MAALSTMAIRHSHEKALTYGNHLFLSLPTGSGDLCAHLRARGPPRLSSPAGTRPSQTVLTCGHAALPDGVGGRVSEGQHHGQMSGRPLIQVQRADPTDVRAQVPVDAGALDTHQDAQVQAGPVRVCRRRTGGRLTVSTRYTSGRPGSDWPSPGLPAGTRRWLTEGTRYTSGRLGSAWPSPGLPAAHGGWLTAAGSALK